MPHLFEKVAVKGLELQNRAVRSATWSGVADLKGFVTDKAVEFYDRLADGGIGLIVTGFQYVAPNAIAIKYQLGNYSDAAVPGLTRLAQAVHAHGGRIMGQLVHVGSKADPDLFPEPGEIWGPSALTDPLTGRTCREMTLSDITLVIEAYAAAAARAKKAGFDGVQLHGAHGYGINQFLAPLFNRRTDHYGGDIASRYRFLGETLEAVRSAVGPEYPVFIKLSADDYIDDGLSIEESLFVAKKLAQDGIDCIEVSAGSRASYEGKAPSRLKITRESDEGYLVPLAKRFKEEVDTPIIAVGGFRSIEVISAVLEKRSADFISMCRPFIREPHLMKRWQSGDTSRATCVSCNGCFEIGLEGDGVACKIDKAKAKKAEG